MFPCPSPVALCAADKENSKSERAGKNICNRSSKRWTSDGRCFMTQGNGQREPLAFLPLATHCPWSISLPWGHIHSFHSLSSSVVPPRHLVAGAGSALITLQVPHRRSPIYSHIPSPAFLISRCLDHLPDWFFFSFPLSSLVSLLLLPSPSVKPPSLKMH